MGDGEDDFDFECCPDCGTELTREWECWNCGWTQQGDDEE